MTEHDFRRLVLALSDAVEGSHMGHPDFRVQNRIFATIHADSKRGMVSLTPEQQLRFISEHPQTFAPASGAWGRSGSTMVTFATADEETIGDAITLAWQNAVAKGPTKLARKKSTASPRRRRG